MEIRIPGHADHPIRDFLPQGRGQDLCDALPSRGEILLRIVRPQVHFPTVDPITGYNPHPRQRIGIWCAPDGEIRLAWLMGRVDADSVRVAEWSANGSTGKMNLRIRENGYLGSNVQRTAVIIPRDTEDSTARMFILTKTGNLYLDDNGGRLRKLRSGLPQSYDFLLFASAVGIWEARHDGKGAVFFTTPWF